MAKDESTKVSNQSIDPVFTNPLKPYKLHEIPIP
jgi:hypothetical protein